MLMIRLDEPSDAAAVVKALRTAAETDADRAEQYRRIADRINEAGLQHPDGAPVVVETPVLPGRWLLDVSESQVRLTRVDEN